MSSLHNSEPFDVPELLTIAEAAKRLRIGRTLAYDLASRFLAGDDSGLPVIRLGGCLRVPTVALNELIRRSMNRGDIDRYESPTVCTSAVERVSTPQISE